MQELGRCATRYDALRFLFAVSDDKIAKVLSGYLADFPNEFEIHVANNYSSNFLRGYCRKASTSHAYFQDCDDYADYELLNNYAHKELSDERVLCFNVTKRFYNDKGHIERQIQLFNLQEGEISDIELLPTCVYSKIIPVRFLREIDYPNLPYSQDWAICYQLYFKCPHLFIDQSTYTYNNYPSSSSAKRFAKLYGTNRVNAFGRYLCRGVRNGGFLYESDILQYKYAVMLTDVYNSIGVKFLRLHLTPRMFLQHFNAKQYVAFLYHSIHSLCTYLRSVCRLN